MKTSSLIKIATRMAMAIPVLPAVGGPLKNRRNNAAKLCAPADVTFNVSDWFHSWINRHPGGGSQPLCVTKTERCQAQ